MMTYTPLPLLLYLPFMLAAGGDLEKELFVFRCSLAVLWVAAPLAWYKGARLLGLDRPVVLRRRAVEPHMRQGVLRRRHRLPPRQGCAPAPLLIRNQRPDAPRATAQDSWHTSSAASSSPSSSVPLPRRSAATSPRPRPRHRPHSPPSSAAAASRGPRSPRSTPATRSLPSSSPSCVPRPPLAPCASRAARRPRIPCIR